MENTKKVDRRVRKTRSLLRQGLMKLMSEKDINDISVTELTELVDINRGTFYLHYEDIYDMLQKIESELFTEFNQILTKNFDEKYPGSLSPLGVLQDIFAFLETNRETARVLVGPHGDLNFVNRLKELVTIHMQHIVRQPDGVIVPYYLSFIVSGCVGVIETWLYEEKPLPAQEMASLCNDMIIKGFSW